MASREERDRVFLQLYKLNYWAKYINMKIITSFIIIMLSSVAAHSAALVYPTATQIDLAGVIGEKDTLETIPYHLAAGYIDKSSPFPLNKRELGKLDISVDGVKMSISSNHYQGLSGVMIEEIKISYIQQWGPKSTIEVAIPYGQSQLCTNHDDGSTHYRKNIKILVFFVSGGFVQSNERDACKH